MPRLLRTLTDSVPKKEQAMKRIGEMSLKEDLIAERKKHQKKFRIYSDSNKIEVVKTYIALGGNLALTAASTGIHLQTLHNWKATAWWKNLVAELKKVEKLEFSQRTKTLIERSMEQLNDRLEHGDVFVDMKTGEIRRKPISAKDLHIIAKDMLDRKNILDKAFEETTPEVSKDDRLAALAERFAKLAEASLEKQQPKIEVTDVVFAKETTSA